MQFSVNDLLVEISAKDCHIPQDERARLQLPLTELANAASEFPNAELQMNVIYHPRSETYHVETRLKLPGRTILTSQKDPYLDTALQRALHRLIHRVEAYYQHPDQEAVRAAERRAAFDAAIVAPEDPEAGPLGEAATAGDYRRFRTALVGYEDWLRNRVGRRIQRHPEAQARVGDGLLLGDVVEEIYLDAFEAFTKRPTDVPLSAWLEKLIEPALWALMQHPDEESAAVSMARTVRATPME